jgi:signal transduction histidine kinase
MTPWQRLNPRLHFAAAIGWAVFAVVTLAALGSATWAAAQAEQRARADAERLLAELATQVRDAVSMNLESRRALLQATAAHAGVARAGDAAALRQLLAATQATFAEFSWLGAADANGRVVAETGVGGPGADVATLAWFQQGRQGGFVSDLHAMPRDPDLQPTHAAQTQDRLIDIAVPLAGDGALGAFLSWAWVEQQVARMQQALNRSRQVELLVTARNGTVLIGPAHWMGHVLVHDQDAAEQGRYIIGARTQLRLADSLGLGWTAIVRQRADITLAPVKALRQTVFLSVFAAGLLSAGLAVWVTRLLTRRLERLAAAAEAVRCGEQRSLAIPAGADELSRIGATLAQTVDHLQAEKQALQSLNEVLDQRVAERTQRIERMAVETRQVAVTRERLRMARDLHDTLAHSLMALLTQIRLVRKLGARLDTAALDAELGRAEEVAASGLVESRAAIAQMRGNGVRDSGLGAALQDMVRRFAASSGLVVALQADAQAGKASDERAETAFRIVEEALRNVQRHALAHQVRVTLRNLQAAASMDRTRIEVADDGIGFDTTLQRPGHYGLRGIHEQAALMGATLQVDSSPGRGTRVVLEFDT